MSTQVNQQESMSVMSAEEKVARASRWLLRNKPMWGTLLMRLKIRASSRKPTMITDGRVIEYNPSFVDRCSVEEVIGVLAHETAHCALKHVFRASGREQGAWEESCDHAVNLMLMKDGFQFPDFIEVYADGEFEGMSAEQVYPVVLARRLQEQEEQEEQQQQAQGGGQGEESEGQGQGENDEGESDPSDQPSDDPSDEQGEQPSQGANDPMSMGEMAAPGSLGGEPGEGEAEAEAQGEEEQPGDAEEEPGDAEMDPIDAPLSEAEQRELEDEWGQAAAAAAQQASSRGEGSARAKRSILEALAQPPSFEEYVRYFLNRCTDRSQQTWQRQSRRSIAAGPYLPGRRGRRMGALALIVDTSGSISDEALGRFRETMQQVQADLRPEEVVVIYADDAVTAERKFERAEPLEIEEGDALGGGGTDFKPALRRVMEMQEEESMEFSGVIYLTDLDGEMHSEEDAREFPPTLWCFDALSVGSVERAKRLIERVQYGEVAIIAA